MQEFNEKKKSKINEFFRNKDNVQKEILMKTQSQKFLEIQQFTLDLNKENFKKLREMAISENGFLTMEIRRKIYDKLLLLGEGTIEEDKYDFLFLDQKKSNIVKNKLIFKKIKIGVQEIGK